MPSLRSGVELDPALGGALRAEVLEALERERDVVGEALQQRRDLAREHILVGVLHAEHADRPAVDAQRVDRGRADRDSRA